MRLKKSMLFAAATVAAVNLQLAVPSYAGLFKIDFGHLENEKEKVDADGNPTGEFPEVLKDWEVIPTWTFEDPNANVKDGSASIKGTANADKTEVTWKLKDFSTPGGDNDVTVTMFDNKALVEAIGGDTPPVMQGQTANNPVPQNTNPVYDGIIVPAVVKDDYNYRLPDTAGTEVLMRFAGLNPGFYNVTAFEGRTTDNNGRFGKVWVDDINGKNEPAAQNTGNYAGTTLDGKPSPFGQPRTVTVEVKAGQFLWFAEMEDNSGGISGLIIRSVDSAAPPPVDISTSVGLFKIDFGHLENERVPVDAENNPTGEAPAVLKDWNVIPTWTFADPNANVTAGSASINGTANSDATEVTWKLTDYSKDANTSVTMTIMDNVALSTSLGLDAPAGQTANNPTRENYEAIYDGVVVPAIVKDDYNYRTPDTAGTELLMRFAGLKPGKYNVTVFEGRTSDGNGRFGKVWVDDITGKKEPAEQNTGNYSGTIVDVGGTPTGQPRTVTVELKAGEFLWFAEMEDNSGGISGLIIRGLGAGTPPAPEVKIEILGVGASALLGGPLTDPDGNGLDALGGATSPTWDWAGITSSHEPNFEGGENAFNIFDHKVGGGNDKWCCDDPTAARPVWVAVQFRTPVSLTHFTVTSGNDTPGRDPTDWAIQGSNDGTTYSDIYVGKTAPWTARNQVIKFTLPVAAPAYTYIRYIAYATPADLHQLNEIEYFGTAAPAFALTVARTATGAAITYTGTLQSADAITGPWADVTGATSPYSVTSTGTAKFFRARQ